MLRKLLLLIVLITGLQLSIDAQLLTFTHLGAKEGIPNGLVFGITQDNKGFIWCASNGGLARFDGYSFKAYKPNPNKKNTVSDKSIHKIFADSRGYLWLSIQGRGLNRMNIETEEFRYFFPDSNSINALDGNEIKAFVEDKQKRLWIGTNRGINLFDTIHNTFIHCLPKTITSRTYPNNYINQIVDADSYLWFLSGNGLGRYNKLTGEVQSLGEITNKKQLDFLNISSFVIDKEEGIWIGTYTNGLYYYSNKNKTIYNYFENSINVQNLYISRTGDLYISSTGKNSSVYVINKVNNSPNLEVILQNLNKFNYNYIKFAEDKEGNIYLATGFRLYVYNPIEKKTSHYQNNIYNTSSLTASEIEYIYIDRNDIIWLSMNRKGIDKADLNQKPFKQYIAYPNIPNSLAGSNITGIYEDRNNNIWVGCYSAGVSCYNPRTNTYKNFPLDINNKNKIQNTSPCTFYQDENGYIWVGYYDGFMDKINIKTGKIIHFNNKYDINNPYYFNSFNVRSIQADKSNNIWLLSSDGYVEYNKKKEKYIFHSRLYEKDYAINYLYRTMYIQNDSIIWAGSQNGGLIKYEKNNHQFTHYTFNEHDKTNISSNCVYSIYDSKDGYLYIGTSRGLNKFNISSKKFEQLGTTNGLPNYSIYSIFPDNKGNFWMSTDNGLLQYSLTSNNYNYYTDNDGLIDNEFATTSHIQTSKGDIYLGSGKGMISFNPADIIQSGYMAKPYITDFTIFNKILSPGDSINGRIILTKQIWATKSITLFSNENDFTLQFSSLNFSSPDKTIYYYQLEGFSDKWVTADAKHRFASFTGLQPGKYTFRLKATNSDGILCKTEDEFVLEINILPPFYLTLWFKISLFAFLIFLSWLFIKLRLRTITRQKELLVKKVKERTFELEETNVMLEERQEEINLQKEELTSQRDSLEESNTLLISQQRQILKQNKELDEHRFQLEKLIEERTIELKEALRKAEESDKLKSSFLANMSHEIRTPMNAIIVFSDLIRKKQITDEERDEFADIIASNGNSLLVLINDILDLSKIQASQIKLKYNKTSIYNLLHSVYESFLVDIKNKGIGIEFRINTYNIDKEWTVDADEVRLRQVLVNLLSNAIKFTKTGFIEFGIYEISEEITFYVKDSGVGIPKEAKESIFERFMKIENNKDQLFGGTGLGLAISKSLVELWQGKIWYDSIECVETTFYFTHPIYHLYNNENKDEQKHAIKLPDFSGKIIAIAEDDSTNFKALQALLKPMHAEIIWAKNGIELLSLVKYKRPDLILMDIQMPIMDGIEAADKMKLIDATIPIIAQTAFAYKNELNEFQKHGMVDCLTKPIDSALLIELLNKYLG